MIQLLPAGCRFTTSAQRWLRSEASKQEGPRHLLVSIRGLQRLDAHVAGEAQPLQALHLLLPAGGQTGG